MGLRLLHEDLLALLVVRRSRERGADETFVEVGLPFLAYGRVLVEIEPNGLLEAPLLPNQAVPEVLLVRDGLEVVAEGLHERQLRAIRDGHVLRRKHVLPLDESLPLKAVPEDVEELLGEVGGGRVQPSSDLLLELGDGED